MAKHPNWVQTVDVEIVALQQNQTWELIPRPCNSNVVGEKYVYRTKCKYDGTIARFKSCLVAQGYT